MHCVCVWVLEVCSVRIRALWLCSSFDESDVQAVLRLKARLRRERQQTNFVRLRLGEPDSACTVLWLLHALYCVVTACTVLWSLHALYCGHCMHCTVVTACTVLWSLHALYCVITACTVLCGYCMHCTV